MNIDNLQKAVDKSNYIVFLGGAGVSTESGIPDFRSASGIYNQKYKYAPETILSSDFFRQKPEEFYDFYKSKMIYLDAQPNEAHQTLSKLEAKGKLKAVITQNIDGLHQKAGSKHVLELHGSVLRNYCTKCGKSFGIDIVIKGQGIPKCDCGGIIKPDVVLFGESLNSDVLEESIMHLSKADLLIIAGTSLQVYPAASLVRYYGGKHIALINKSATAMDEIADLVYYDSVGKVLGLLKI